MSLPVNRSIVLAAPFLLAACSMGAGQLASAPAAEADGAEADYPVVLGDPFTIDGTTWTPEDVMNYDAVGHADLDDTAQSRVVGAHRTLPLPSYVEVTHLETGRTILVRIEARGPMRNDVLIGLSPAAAAQLGAEDAALAPVRVRRVNPPEQERAMLRAGEPVPPRMDTPAALLVALKKKLGAVTGRTQRPLLVPALAIGPDEAQTGAGQVEMAKPAKPEPAVARRGRFVQVGAFSNEANARKAAGALSAMVSREGKLWLVRLGPFAGRVEADAALAKARTAGYGDAMVRTVD